MLMLQLLCFVLTLIVPHALSAKNEDKPASDIVIDIKAEKAKDELSDIEDLILATDAQLARLKSLRKEIDEYRAMEKKCIDNPKDSALLFKLADAGKKLYTAIQNCHVENYVAPGFVKELQKLSQIADKKSIPPAR